MQKAKALFDQEDYPLTKAPKPGSRPASKPPFKQAFKRGAKKTKPGFAARKIAQKLVARVLDEQEPFEYLLDREDKSTLPENDKALARAIASTTLRRRHQIDALLASRMDKPLGKRGGDAMHIMRVAVAQLLFMDVPDHAAVATAMDVAKADAKARHFARLINGVLRGITREKDDLLKAMHARDILPDWLSKSWARAYGVTNRDLIAKALAHEPYLDISLKDPSDTALAEKLDGTLLPFGTVRTRTKGSITKRPGFEEGAWWVQDTAARLAANLINAKPGDKVLDLCAAPGGKTALLASQGADVTALDIADKRLKKLHENLKRLDLKAKVITADIFDWKPDALFDAILLDAPCSATGTIRKHPDILSLKRPEQVAEMQKTQRAMVARCVEFLKPGGTLVFCTCSLQPEEGEDILDFVTGENMPLALSPITEADVHNMAELITDHGTVRTLPHHMVIVPETAEPGETAGPDPILSGMDGFFMARFTKDN